MTDSMNAGVKVERYFGDEEAFVPQGSTSVDVTLTPKPTTPTPSSGEQGTSIHVELEPVTSPEEKPIPTKITRIDVLLEKIPEDVKDLYPPPSSYTTPTYIPPTKKPLIINIESTGLLPWESRMIAIGTFDPAQPEQEPVVFQHESESQMIAQFLSYFEAFGYDQIIGYNVSFDFRFLFAACERYRYNSQAFFDSELVDLMQIQKQVREEYVYGFNKPGTLDQWAAYLLNLKPPATQAQVLAAYVKQDLDVVREYTIYKVLATYGIYMLGEYTKGSVEIPALEEQQSNARQAASEATGLRTVYCPNCGQEHEVPEDLKAAKCIVCGTRFEV